MLDVKDKKITVIGLSRTGVASARMLNKWGARVLVSDAKKAEELQDEITKLNDIEIEYELGGHGERCLDADMIVTSPGVPLDIPLFRKAQERGIPVISEVELAYHFTEARIIAITGTNGKTTTTSLIGEILKNSIPGQVRIAGNIGTPLVSEAAGLTSDDWLVVEISSFQLETIVDFKPDISVYLNFTPDHLDRHKTIDNYWQAKKRIFMNQGEGDIAVVNYDDPEVMRAVKDFPGSIYQVSVENSSKDLKPAIVLVDGILKIYDRNEEISIMDVEDIPLKGRHNIQNVAFAAMAAYLAGAAVDIIKDTVMSFRASDHRLQSVDVNNDSIMVIDDSKATNPDAGIKGVKAFERPIVLIAGGQDRNADFNQWAVKIKDRVRELVLIGETKDKMKDEALKQGFNNINIHIADKMQDAVKIAADLVQDGDCLLLSPACPSWDMYPSYKVRGKEFQDEVKIRFQERRA